MADVQTEMPLTKISEGEAFSVVNYFHVFTECPDGSKVAYTRFPEGPHDGQSGKGEVVVCDRDGSNSRCVGTADEVVQHRGAVPTWVDDRRLLYSTGGDGHGPVVLVDVESGDEQEYDGGLDNYSPDLGRTYFHADYDGQPAVWYLDLESEKKDVVVTMEQMQAFAAGLDLPFEPVGLAHTYVAPGGESIAFRVGKQSESVIILADPDGSNLRLFGRKMMHWTYLDSGSFFGHDDVFMKDKHMRRWDLEGNIIEELSGPGCHGSISPDGQWIVTESWYGSEEVNVYLYRRGETEPTCILARTQPPWSTRAHVHPSFSRDGRRVYFNYNAVGSRGSEVYACDLDPWVDG